MINTSTITVFPSSLEGTVSAPPSKSLSHRALICAALANGKSTIRNLIYSEDVLATISALESLGAKFEIIDNQVVVQGIKKIKLTQKEINCNESGSTLRFMIPIASLSNKTVTFTGKESLIQRPQSVYKKLFEDSGNRFDYTKDKIVVSGCLKPNIYNLKGDISSQFFSGLLFALPLLEGDSTLLVDGPLESKSYIDLTIQMLSLYGIKVQEIENGYFIEGNQKYIPVDYYVEGDYSQAAFFLVGGVLNGSINVTNLSHESLQGDKEILSIIKAMKGRTVFAENGFITSKSNTIATTIDIQNCPDLGPIISLLASCSKGTTKIINAGRLRLKESDRIEAIVTTLQLLGATIKTVNDEIIIHGKPFLKGGVTVDSYNDHRIAMMLTIASTVIKEKIAINRAQAINKSYPHFYNDFESLGGKLSR